MDTAVGAEAWPSGLHVWNGNKAPNTPKPKNTAGKNRCCISSGILCKLAISSTFIVCAPAP